MKPVMVVVNPVSGGGRTARRWPELERVLKGAGLDCEAVFTTGPGDATRIARRGVREGRELIVAAGGDGTISETAAGFFAEGRPVPTETRFGVLPTGTGGDFRRTFRIPIDPRAAALVLAGGGRRRIDAGLVRYIDRDGHPEQRTFVNIADAGIGGEVVHRVNTGPKALPGPVTFYLASVRTLLSWKNRPLSVTVDGLRRELVAQQVVVANCQYFGGGMRMAPMALPDDGLLDVIVVGDVNPVENARGLGRIRKGTHLEDHNPKIKAYRGKRVEVESEFPIPLDVDGEGPGTVPAIFEVIPQALTLMVPL
ncbi:MAG TPA: diacylglycerol kinase family protein [Candidatus Dormibacteraeota bacterium]